MPNLDLFLRLLDIVIGLSREVPVRPGVRADRSGRPHSHLLENLRVVGRMLADREERGLRAMGAERVEHEPQCWFGQGPSSKVSTTSLLRRKSCCVKCSNPKPGPPVVSISTVRAIPSASGLPGHDWAWASAGPENRDRQAGSNSAHISLSPESATAGSPSIRHRPWIEANWWRSQQYGRLPHRVLQQDHHQCGNDWALRGFTGPAPQTSRCQLGNAPGKGSGVAS